MTTFVAGFCIFTILNFTDTYKWKSRGEILNGNINDPGSNYSSPIDF